MTVLHKDPATPTAVQELYAWYRVARELGELPTFDDVVAIHEGRHLGAEPPGFHTYTSLGKAWDMGDPTWTNLNDVDRRHTEWRRRQGR